MARKSKLKENYTTTWTVEGMDELQNAIKRLGELPRKHVRASARAGASLALQAVRSLVPVDKGELKKGLIMKEEKRTVNSKSVFDIIPDPKKNDIFVKINKDGSRSYYPASMEFGFIQPDGSKFSGFHYMRDGVSTYEAQIRDEILHKMEERIEQAWASRG